MGKLLRQVAILAGLIGAVLTSCNSSGCLDNRSAIPLAEFYNSETGQSLTLDSLEIRGLGAPGDSVLVSAGTAVSQAYLPMRSSHELIQWCFAYRRHDLDDAANNDTLSIRYASLPYFASNECGVIYQYHISELTHTSHYVDSVAIADSVVTNIDKVYLKVYFKPLPEEENGGGDDAGDEEIIITSRGHNAPGNR